jgi:hypothetical protein
MVAALLVIATFAPTVGAAVGGFEIVIPINTFVKGTEGEFTELATEQVPEEFHGQTCSVIAVSENQTSVHPNNNIHVESGGSSVLLEDVESVPGKVEGSGVLVLGPTIVVLLEFGDDGLFSAGINIVIDCTAPPATTSTTTIKDEVSPTSIVNTTTTIVSTTAAEVSQTEETLPFTGAESGTPAALALVLIASGALALVGARAFHAEADE